MLKDLFDKIEIPNDTQEDSYNTKEIFKSNHRLGKNLNNEPSLLFKTQDNNVNQVDYLGKYIHLRFNVKCTLNEKNKKVSENYTILTCISEDDYTKKIFLEICESTYLNIGELPSNNEIIELTQSLIELFKSWSTNVTDFIGLWGELFLIVSSSNQIKCLEAWHDHNEDKYDFYDNSSALEVKCTTKNDRKHEFRHHQLTSNLDDHFIASVLTKPDQSKGLSVFDLYKKILNKKINSTQKNKLNKIYYSIVKGTPENLVNTQKYDYDFAKKNLMYFKVSDISTLKNNDQSITNIKYTMDLSQKQNLSELPQNEFISCLYFSY